MKRQSACEAIDSKAKALALRDYTQLIFDGRNGLRTRVEGVYLIKSREERDLARVAIPVSDSKERIVKFNAWIQYPSGKIETLTRQDLVMLAGEEAALYSEAGQWIVDRSGSIRDGCLFAFEYEVMSRTNFTQSLWTFQSHIPVALSLVEVVVPKGWQAEGVVLNDRGVEASSSGQTYRWSAENLPGIKEDELHRPPASLLVTQVGITASPIERSSRDSHLRPFRNWNELARYADEVQQESIVPDGAIEAKARELAAGGSDRLSVLRRITEFTQSLNYVMVNTDINTGGGYTPHAAKDVLDKHYGDCKDMTALTRSLLGVLGIDSYAVIASVGEDSYVHPEWPSPLMFNHCITAIPVDESIVGQAVVEHPQLGRLLIFDATQRYTPLGSLPGSLLGTRILVGSDQTKELLQLPMGDPEVDSVERRIDVEIDKEGTMSGTIIEVCSGSIAEYMRAVYRRSSDEDFQKFVRRWISNGTRDSEVDSMETIDDFEANTFTLTVKFTARRYGRVMKPDLLLFGPVFLSRHEWVPPVAEERESDYVTEPVSIFEEIRFTYPEGMALDSMREPVERKESFLDYSLGFEELEHGLLVRRRIVSRDETIPVARYGELVGCYEAITRSESAPVVLRVVSQ